MSEPGKIGSASGNARVVRGGVRKKSINDINAQFDRILAGMRGNNNYERWNRAATAAENYIRNIESQPEQRRAMAQLGRLMMNASNQGELNSPERARITRLINSRRYPRSVYAKNR